MRYPFIFLFFFYHLAIADEFNSLIEEYSSSNNISKVNIVIKDNIDIKGKATTAGSLALVNNTAKENAFLIEKLLANNFHIKGKSNYLSGQIFDLQILLVDGQVLMGKQIIH